MQLCLKHAIFGTFRSLWVILEHCDFLGTFFGKSAILFGTWMEWLTSDASRRLVQFEGRFHYLNDYWTSKKCSWRSAPRRIYDANAVLKLFFGKFWEEKGGKLAGRRATTKDEKAMTRGNELVSFLVIATKWTCYVLHRVRKERM